MKRLFLLRHAKAGFGTSDLIRPLAKRGRQDAYWLGQYLKDANLLPDHILCSSANRAKESLSQLQNGANTALTSSFHQGLYLASAAKMMQHLQALKPSILAPMIIGHNPGLSSLFQDLALNPPLDDYSLKYPTCMVTILDFDIKDWSELKSNTGQLFDLIIPSLKQQNGL